MSGSVNDGTSAKVAERLSHCVLSISNLTELVKNTSPSQSISKLPKDLIAKVPSISKTGTMLEQMPGVIADLDAHLDRALVCLSELDTVELPSWDINLQKKP